MADWTYSKDNREFLIHTPYTPRPWINYLTNGRCFALVSQTGGGFSFYADPSHHVITRREQDMLLNDRLSNGWTPYQIIIKSYLSSAPSYYHASDGSPGFRDAIQDAFGLCLLEPERARQLILRWAGFQFSDGSATILTSV